MICIVAQMLSTETACVSIATAMRLMDGYGEFQIVTCPQHQKQRIVRAPPG